MPIPEEKIQAVLERVDLVALVSQHVELKKAGRSWRGLCPFHQEKTPSFHVTPDLGLFKCFGCGVGGDAIAFLRRQTGKGFLETVRELAREVDVDLGESEDPKVAQRARMRESCAVALERFSAQLRDESGRAARAYLASRGVSEATCAEFGLGWAPLHWTLLADELRRRGILEWALQAGLVMRKQTGEGFLDVFRGRLMIPIRAPDGRTVGFGARLMEGNDGPKYLNSRESLIYAKSEILYGADKAREEIRRRRSAILVEGYFDCIGLHQVGVKNAVALCSTALTAGHLGLLSRLEAKNLVLLLDGDSAGRKAVERLAGPILAAGATAHVALLPEGEDPDTFALREGQQGVQKLLDSARPLSEHLLEVALPKGPDSSFEEKMAALDRLRPTAAVLPVGLVRSAFFATCARHFGLKALELEAALRGGKAEARPAVRPVPKSAEPARAARSPEAKVPRLDPTEAALVACALRAPELLASARFQEADALGHPASIALVDLLASGRPPDEALEDASPSTRAAIEQAGRQLPPNGPWDAIFFTLLRRLRVRRIDQQLAHRARMAGQMGASGELNEELRRLLAERAELVALRQRILSE